MKKKMQLVYGMKRYLDVGCGESDHRVLYTQWLESYPHTLFRKAGPFPIIYYSNGCEMGE
jgi:hypothetical protein